MLLKAVAFDWGHTVVDENRDVDIPLDVRPVHVMPGVSEVLPRIALPLALWANTRLARESGVRMWLRRAGLDHVFRWVMTSVDAGAVKPTPQFFGSLYPALRRMEQAGWLRAAWVDRSGRRARAYELTRAGQKHLANVEAKWHTATAAVNRVLKMA
jgi:Transcriptional regulator PadR-like family